MVDVDLIVSDPDDEVELVEGPAVDRVPTKPITPRAGDHIRIDLTDPETVAAFLEMVARVVREKRRLVITIE